MIKTEVIGLQQIGTTSEHTFYSSEGASDLALFFPGGNSNTSGPYFYYLRDYFLRNGYNVLSLSYIGLVEKGEPYEVQLKKVKEGVHKAIQYINAQKTYQKTVFASRSFGNVVSNLIRKQHQLDVHKCINISPTAEALEDIKVFPSLIITSNHDEYLNEELVQDIQSYPNHEVLVFKDGDHGLECSDTLKNIEFCSRSIAKAIKFIESD